ncbi:uncharacterized protein LOC128257791 isoform X2 [Drosophila gunungcola]|uniref:uncharacterized protein LOC128257791 isoform X2 n=1 Tax=Drosophila gunungcola TaxID=103775 RepID=UPI0022E7F64F|nr:uncharacterized protein LOC128257791 isoform X2 [Drosophila gunungcola]
MLLMPTSCGPGPPPTDLGPSSSSLPPPTQRAADDGDTVRRSGTQAPRTISGSSIPQWLIILLGLFAILAQTPSSQVAAEKSKHYYMQSLCKNHFLQQLYRKIDGAVLWSQNERNLDCIITFQTHSVLQRFMLRFDMLQLDCNDHLLVYDGAHAVATPKIDISCRNTKNTVNALLTRTNFVTLKYVTDGWGTDANGFKLVITSVKDPTHLQGFHLRHPRVLHPSGSPLRRHQPLRRQLRRISAEFVPE